MSRRPKPEPVYSEVVKAPKQPARKAPVAQFDAPETTISILY